ncbi:RlmE family RNA methyltransferase [Aestuariivirga litoralis]|uniref:RlmE family RNA methyltransferase n=1 Tax=Aestuariivirga litoralis TaxID=2650924 RepID=UPI0018C63512|nr:RlmE family RNA methyltransferase [Aestuariivirga litoralis]MBG1231089.1 RlmE family RNA methyltransferase [Aestuariivirga litoralis]
MARPGQGSKPQGNQLKVRVKTGKGRTVAQKIWLERQLNDPYVIEAKKLGYRSRAAFKLIEIDDKYKFLKVGGRIVDLGAAPGGWSQVAAKRVKAEDGKGRVVAIDMHGMDPLPAVTIFKKDFYDEDAPRVLIDALGGEKADCVLSDMASHATGHRQTDHINIIALAETGYEFAREVLKPGGTYLAKVLRGGTEGQLLTMMKKDFTSVRHVKPMASRDDSAELFVLAMGFRG